MLCKISEKYKHTKMKLNIPYEKNNASLFEVFYYLGLTSQLQVYLNITEGNKQPLQVLYKKGDIKNVCKIHRKYYITLCSLTIYNSCRKKKH